MDFSVDFAVRFSADLSFKTHIVTGPLFILCWNLFPTSPYARYFAAAIPCALVTKFTLIGLGILKDEVTVKSMSRSGVCTVISISNFYTI